MSNSKLKRLVEQGAIEIDGEKVKDWNAELVVSSVFRIGKKNFKEVVFYKGKILDLLKKLI